MTDRIACVNPSCRRTASAAKFPNTPFIVCAKCWKLLPERVKRRNKALHRRDKKLSRIAGKERFRDVTRRAQWDRVSKLWDEACNASDRAIIDFFTSSPAPVGLETFLQENGFA